MLNPSNISNKINFSAIKSHPLTLIIIVSTIILFAFSSLRHILFQSTAFEMGIYDQVAYLISQGKTPYSSFLEVHHLGNHVAFAMYPVGIIYAIFPSVYTLLFIQSFSLAMGALPTYHLAKHAGLNKSLSLAISLAYLLYPLIFNINLFDFHPEVMALPAILGAILAAKLDQNKWFILSIIWILSCKDALALTVIMLGFWLIFWENKKKLGAIALSLGIAWLIIATQVIIPAYKAGAGPGGVGRYLYLGSSLGEIIINLLLRPDIIFFQVFSAKTLEYLFLLVSPVIWWLSPQYLSPLWAGSLTILANILSRIDAQRDLIHQYSLPVLPFLILAVIYTLADGKVGLWHRISLWLEKDAVKNFIKKLPNICQELISKLSLPKLIVLWSLIAFIALAKYGYFWSLYADSLDTWQATRNAVNLVKSKGGVYTTSEIAPHLSQREVIKLTKNDTPLTKEDLAKYDYILLNSRHPGWKSDQKFVAGLLKILQNNIDFQLVYNQDDVYLFQRKNT